MHLAKAGEETKTIVIPAKSVGGETYTTGYVDVDFAVPQGAIVRSIVAFKGTQEQTNAVPVLTCGSLQISEMWDRGIVWTIFWERLTDQTIRINYNIRHYDPGTVTAPSISFKLQQAYFKPPNA